MYWGEWLKEYFFALIFVMVLFSFSKNQTKDVEQRPNIIIIYSDDQRQDAVGANGNKIIITPELDKLAQKGIRFTNANVVFSLCSPSRAALLTGRYGSANGVLHLGSDLNSNEKTIASYLKEAGYNTAISGKWHIERKPKSAGFDFYVYFKGNGTYYGREINDMGKTVKPEIHCDEYCVNRSIQFLKDAILRSHPFFLFHNTQLPHMNGKLVWDARPETKEKYNVEKMPVTITRLDDLSNKPEYLKKVRNRVKSRDYGYPNADAIKSHTVDYYSVITEMDNALGRLFRTINELGLWENTYVFFMSDNGWMLGEHGFTSKVLPYEPSVHVPLFIIGPDINPRVCDEIVLNIDIAPTLLEIAGIKIPQNMHGQSLFPLLTSGKQRWRQASIYEGLGDYGDAKPNLTVISKDYRYIVTYEDENLNKIIFRELYDQVIDPDEMVNLANNLSYQSIIEKLDGFIENHREKILNLDSYKK